MIRRGFTLIELVVVIAVIAILVTITGILYSNVQAQARDTQIRDSADKLVAAIQLFYVKYEHWPRGGNGNTLPLSGTECPDGNYGWFGKGIYGATKCTAEDTLVASGYLPSGFSAQLPRNTIWTPNASFNYALMIYQPMPNRGIVLYSMESQTPDDQANFTAELARCGWTAANVTAQQNTNGMRNAICFDL